MNNRAGVCIIPTVREKKRLAYILLFVTVSFSTGHTCYTCYNLCKKKNVKKVISKKTASLHRALDSKWMKILRWGFQLWKEEKKQM